MFDERGICTGICIGLTIAGQRSRTCHDRGMADAGDLLVGASFVANVAQAVRNSSLTDQLAGKEQQLAATQQRLVRELALRNEMQAQLQSERAARAGVEVDRHNLRLQLADVRAKHDALVGQLTESEGRQAALTRDVEVERARVRELETQLEAARHHATSPDSEQR